MKNGRLRHLEIMLNDWADWEYLRNPYKSCTVEATAGQGRSPNRLGSSIPKAVETPERIKRVNAAVKQLGDFHPDLKLVVILRYSRQPDGKPRPAQMQHRTFSNVTRKGARAFSERLGRAHAWLDGRLA